MTLSFRSVLSVLGEIRCRGLLFCGLTRACLKSSDLVDVFFQFGLKVITVGSEFDGCHHVEKFIFKVLEFFLWWWCIFTFKALSFLLLIGRRLRLCYDTRKVSSAFF